MWIMLGSWDNVTTAMIWHPDDINVAWSFNGRKDDVDLGGELWDKTVKQLIEEERMRLSGPKRKPAGCSFFLLQLTVSSQYAILHALDNALVVGRGFSVAADEQGTPV